MNFSLINAAHAAPAGTPGFDWMGLVPFVLIIGIMYFFLIRPQQKKAKDHQELLKSLAKGDKILTAGGVFGVVHKLIDDTKVDVEVAPGFVLTMLRSSVSQILSDKASATVVTNKSVDTVAAATNVKKVKKSAVNSK